MQEVEEEARIRSIGFQRSVSFHDGRTLSYKCAKRRLSSRADEKGKACKVVMYCVKDDDGAFHLYTKPEVLHEHGPGKSRDSFALIKLT